MPRLFISHSSKDNAQALAFQNWLVAAGWTREEAFIDLHGIGAGERWREKLRQANKQCEAVILLASPASLESVECQREMSFAEEQGKEIIIVLLRALTTDDPRLVRYRDRQFVDLSAKPTEPMEPFEFNGKVRRVSFNVAALNSIKVRLANLGIAPESFAWPPKGVTKPQPYPGLAFFTEDDAGIFFGRDAEILSALTDIRQMRRRRAPRLIVIDAASGAGKSSFLRAGLWPRLKRDPDFAALAVLRPAQGIITGPDGIGRRIATFFAELGKPTAPGPINAAIGNSDAAAGAEALADLLQEAIGLAATARRTAGPEARAPAALIAIDQGEELFAAENEPESRHFLTLLAAVLKDPPEDVDLYVILTIRADSKEALLARAAALGLETPKPVYLSPMLPAAYRDLIVKPAEVYATKVSPLAVDPTLAHALIADATGADALPLLAFTLARLFADYAPTGELTGEHYRQMGGVTGSIKRALDDALRRSGPAGTDQNLRRLIIPHLATWDPEADRGKGAAKRVVAAVAEVTVGDRTALAPLAEALVAARLLTRSRAALEVAHEALLRQPPIADWLEEDREFLVWRDRLARERASYAAKQRGLLAGPELQIAHGWLAERQTGDIAQADQKFVEQSAEEAKRLQDEANERERQRQTAELAAAQAREQAARAAADTAEAHKRAAEEAAKAALVAADAQREMAEAAGKHANEQRRRAKIAFRFGVIAALAAIVSVILGFYSVSERGRAESQRQLAESQRQLAESQRQLAEQRLELARDTVETLVSFIVKDLRRVQGIQTATLRRILDKAKSSFDRLSSEIGHDSTFDASRADMMSQFGETYLKAGDGKKASEAYSQSLRLYRTLAGKEPNVISWQRGIADQIDNIGVVLQQEGNYNDARVNFQQALEIRLNVANRDPDNSISYRDIASSYYNVGELDRIQGAPQKALANQSVALTNIESALSRDKGNRDDLELKSSLIHISLGTDYEALGRNDDRLKSSLTALDIRKRLVDTDPDNAEWRRLLSWAYQYVGGSYEDAENWTEALENYQQCLLERQKLVTGDPGDMRAKSDLAWGYQLSARALKALGRSNAAEYFNEAFKIRKELTSIDEGNRRWRKDLALSYVSLGDLADDQGNRAEALTQFEAARAFFDKLTIESPTDVNWRQEHSNVLNKIANLLKLSDDLQGALLRYREALTIRNNLHAENPENVSLMVNAATSEFRVGEVLQRLGEADQALEHYAKSRDLRKGILAREPGNTNVSTQLGNVEKAIASLAAQEQEGDKRE